MLQEPEFLLTKHTIVFWNWFWKLIEWPPFINHADNVCPLRISEDTWFSACSFPFQLTRMSPGWPESWGCGCSVHGMYIISSSQCEVRPGHDLLRYGHRAAAVDAPLNIPLFYSARCPPSTLWCCSCPSFFVISIRYYIIYIITMRLRYFYEVLL